MIHLLLKTSALLTILTLYVREAPVHALRGPGPGADLLVQFGGQGVQGLRCIYHAKSMPNIPASQASQTKTSVAAAEPDWP